MKTTPIKRRILNVLVQYKESGFLTVSDIARLAYGSAYIRDTRKHLDKLVRRNIYSVMDLAIENNMIVLPVKERNKDGEIEKKTRGYKIAGKEDSAYVDMLLEDKEKRANAYLLAYNNTINELESRNLIEKAKYQLKLIS